MTPEYKEEIKQALSNAIDNNFVDFRSHIENAVQIKTSEHPGVQAYKEDMNHYNSIFNAIKDIGTPYSDNDSDELDIDSVEIEDEIEPEEVEDEIEPEVKQ